MPGGDKTLVFKLFPNHLAHDLISGEILPRDDIGYLLLRRRPIEAFISETKAALVSAYTVMDTTGLRPELEVGRFVRRVTRARLVQLVE